MFGKRKCNHCNGTGINELKKRCGVCEGKGSYCEHEWVFQRNRKSTFKDGEENCGSVDIMKCKHCGKVEERLQDY